MIRELKQLGRTVSKGIHRWWTNWCNWVFGLEVRFVRTSKWLWFGLIQWTKRIRLHFFLQGLPALLILVGIVFATAITYHNRTDWVHDYENKGQQSLHKRNFERVRVIYERLSQAYPNRASYRFALALALQQTNQTERAAALMEQLAPADRQGYAPAHLLVAGELLKNQPKNNKSTSLAELHLHRVLQTEPNNPVAHAILGQLNLRSGRLDQAEKHLRRAVDAGQMQVYLLLLRLYRQENRQMDLPVATDRAIQFYQEQLKNNPDDIGTKLALAEVYSLSRKHVEAITLLQDGLRLRKDKAMMQQLVQCYAVWIDEKSLNTSQQLAIIEQGLRIDSQSGPLLLKLAQITGMQGKQGDRARALLQSLLARGQQTSTLYLSLGIDAQQRGKTTEATHYLQRAFELNSQMPVVANNLAYVLAQAKNPDLDRALQIINEVIKRHPGDYRFRDTRGQILVKMRRWKEALADLEPCIPHMAKDRQLHKLLAETYRQLGMLEPARIHERLARQP